MKLGALIALIAAVVTVLWAGLRIYTNEQARNNPPICVQLLGGHWTLWDGWQCGVQEGSAAAPELTCARPAPGDVYPIYPPAASRLIRQHPPSQQPGWCSPGTTVPTPGAFLCRASMGLPGGLWWPAQCNARRCQQPGLMVRRAGGLSATSRCVLGGREVALSGITRYEAGVDRG